MAVFKSPFHCTVLAMAVMLALHPTAIASNVQPIVLGSGLENPPRAMIEYKGELIAAGNFTWLNGQHVNGVRVNRLARWTGQQWQPYGDVFDHSIRALIEYRGDLIAAGHFTKVGDKIVNGIARWDGSAWQPLGEGFWKEKNMQVRALGIYKDELIAGGWFDTAGGRPAKHIARWDGSQWRAFGKGAGSTVRSMTVYNDELVIVGDFDVIDGTPARRIASWDGSRWQALGGGLTSHVNTVTVYRGELIAAGMLSFTEHANRIVRWDGKRWHPMGQVMTGATPESPVGAVFELAVHNNVLFAGGWFRLNADHDVAHLAMWDGSEWQSAGVNLSYSVLAMASYKGRLYVGGHFRYADGQLVNRIIALDPPRLPTVLADTHPDPRSEAVSESQVRIVRLGQSGVVNLSTSAVRANGALTNGGGDHRVQSFDDVESSEQHIDTERLLRFRAVAVQPPMPYRRLWLSAINDLDEAVGYAASEHDFERSVSLFWSIDQGVALGHDASWVQSVATAINDDGVVTGWARNDAGSRFGYLWDHANTIVALANMSYPVDIDSAGRVLGVTHAGLAAVWDGDAVDDLPLLPGGHRFIPAAMNDHQCIVGSGQSDRTGNIHAFAYTDGQYIDLGLALREGESEAVAISNSGLVLGLLHLHEVADAEATRMVIWNLAAESMQTPKVIDPPAGYRQIIGMDINDKGDVVGHFGWPRTPFLYTGGVLHNLHDLVEPSDAMFVTATHINNNGWITADGDDGFCAYMLIPTTHRRGDLASNGDVGIADVLVLFDAWGACPATGACAADMNDDGQVDALDLLQLLDTWSSGQTVLYRDR